MPKKRPSRFQTGRAEPTYAAVAGAGGERVAANYLARVKGFTVIESNWRNPADEREEIDLIALDGEIVVFVEVKTRSVTALVPGVFRVDYGKRRVLRRAAMAYLRQLQKKPRTFRLDVVEVELGPAEPVVRHFTNVSLFHRHYRP